MTRDQAEKLWENAFGWHFTGGEGCEAENNPLFRQAALMFFTSNATFLNRPGGTDEAVAFLREWADALEREK